MAMNKYLLKKFVYTLSCAIAFLLPLFIPTNGKCASASVCWQNYELFVFSFSPKLLAKPIFYTVNYNYSVHFPAPFTFYHHTTTFFFQFTWKLFFNHFHTKTLSQRSFFFFLKKTFWKWLFYGFLIVSTRLDRFMFVWPLPKINLPDNW